MKERLEEFCKEMLTGGILYDEAVREFKKTFIGVALSANRGNQCKAARQLGKHRSTLARTMHELKLDTKEARSVARRNQKARYAANYLPANSPILERKQAEMRARMAHQPIPVVV